MEEITDVLREFGLNENESKAYFAGLLLGSATANDIAYKAGLLRTTTYEILKRLTHKGLVTEYEQNKIKYFDMVDPQEMVMNMETLAKRMKTILPNLEKIRETAGKRPKAEVIYGYKGIKNLLDMQIESKENIFVIAKVDMSNKFLGYYRSQYIKKRAKHGIKMRFLCEPGNAADQLRRSDKKEIRETKTLQFCNNLESSLSIFGDKSAIITFLKEDPVGILINNKNIADSFKIIFKEFWKRGK